MRLHGQAIAMELAAEIMPLEAAQVFLVGPGPMPVQQLPRGIRLFSSQACPARFMSAM